MIGKVELSCILLLTLPKVMGVEEANDLAIMSMEELLGTLIPHGHTLEIDKEDVETNKKKNKDIAFKILMQEKDEDLDEGMALLPRNCKRFLKKKV